MEIQQNSNTTYRVYDWGRVGNDGKPREMHIDKALQVIDFKDAEDPTCTPVETAPSVRTICTSDFFVLEELTVDGVLEQTADGSTFHVLFSAEGGFDITYADQVVESVPKGTSVLIPASLGSYALGNRESTVVLKASVPV